jgi:hypothetical protein
MGQACMHVHQKEARQVHACKHILTCMFQSKFWLMIKYRVPKVHPVTLDLFSTCLGARSNENSLHLI